MIPLFLLLACGKPCDPGAIDVGAGAGEIDGAEWQGDNVQWSPAGEAVQVTTDTTDGWRITVVSGTAPGEEELELTPGDGNLVTVYADGGGSYAANEADQGTITVWEGAPDEVWACVDVTASSAADEAIELVAVALRAAAL